MTFERIVQYAKDEGDYYRAPLDIRGRHFGNDNSGNPTRTRSCPIDNREDPHFHNEVGEQTIASVDTSELPPTITEAEEKKLNNEQEKFLLM